MFKLIIMALTGRLFKCVTLEGVITRKLVDWYKVGETYQECDSDAFGKNLTTSDTLLLHSNIPIPMLNDKGDLITHYPQFYLETKDFELVQDGNK